MFKKEYKIIAESDKEIYRLMRIAANHCLYGEYKIGVYGCERQHELYLLGYPWDYHAFLKEVERLKQKAVEPEKEEA